MTDRPDAPAETVARLRALCLALPEVVEEQAWAGTRWVVRGHTFAHVVAITDGWPPAYAAAAGTDGPAVVLTFRSPSPEREALEAQGHPFFKPVWFTDIVGLHLEPAPDWDEVAELVTESYRALAPRSLASRLDEHG